MLDFEILIREDNMVILYLLGALGIILGAYILLLILCSLLVNTKREYGRDSKFYRWLLNSATAAMIKLLRIRVHITGMEKLPQGQLVLFVGNHISNFDPILSWYAFRKWKLAFVSKPENFKIPFFGRIIRKCCFMPIDRENPRNAIVTINRAAKLLKKQEVSIGIYPEGTRSKSGELLPFHNGVFKIAQKASAPVAVLSVKGTEHIAKNIPFRKTDVYMDVLEVIPADEVAATKTETMGQRIREILEQNRKLRKRERNEHDLHTV